MQRYAILRSFRLVTQEMPSNPIAKARNKKGK